VPFAIPSALFEGLFFVSLAVFWRIFLDLPRRYPTIDRILLGLVGINVLRTILILVLPQPGWIEFTDIAVACSLILTALVAAVRAARSGYRPARFLIIALAGLLFFWGLSYPVEWMTDLPPWPYSLIIHNGDGIYFGVVWDALFLTFALADRIETANRGMIAAQSETLIAQAETVQRLQERDTAVSRFLLNAFLERLGRANVVDLQLGDHVESEMTILFSDIRSFTALSEEMSPEQTFRFLNAYLRRAGPIIRAHDGFVDKYIGDAIMGLFPNAAHTALDAAIDLHRGLDDYNRERARVGDPAIAIGVGLHRGRLMLGAIGESERIETTVIADAVNIASRTESLTKQFRAPVIATAAVIAALERPEDYRLRPLGEVVVYGASHGIEMFEVFDGDAPELLLSKVRTLDDFTAGVHAFTAGDFEKAGDAFARVLEQSSHDRTAAYFAEQSRLLAEGGRSTPWDGRIRMDVK
jgi:class 3 adenylate cyclase